MIGITIMSEMMWVYTYMLDNLPIEWINILIGAGSSFDPNAEFN